VRSARTADPDVLSQFGVPVLAYSGGAPNVVRVVEAADLVSIDETAGAGAYIRDENRVSPHNLYTGTEAIYRVAKAGKQAPMPVFAYADELSARARRVSSIHLPFSPTYSDVYWTWNRRAGEWRRAHGTEPHLDESGEPISATNVVVQIVPAVIPAGGITPQLDLTGSGRAYVFRDGRMIVGRWERSSLHDVTTFVTKDGQEIELAPDARGSSCSRAVSPSRPRADPISPPAQGGGRSPRLADGARPGRGGTARGGAPSSPHAPAMGSG
jgi:hypothetical protein